jgi:hypothetical protein
MKSLKEKEGHVVGRVVLIGEVEPLQKKLSNS